MIHNFFQRIFRPNVNDLTAMRVESLDDYYVVITGSGVDLIGGEYVEFWEIQETRGKYFADYGFTRLERHKGLIKEVYEFQV